MYEYENVNNNNKLLFVHRDGVGERWSPHPEPYVHTRKTMRPALRSAAYLYRHNVTLGTHFHLTSGTMVLPGGGGVPELLDY